MSAWVWLAAGALGGLAAVGRFAIDAAVGARTGGAFPWGTLAVNLSGAFVLGILAGAALEGNARVLAETATLGSYTTFSTWMLESRAQGEDGRLAPMALNLGGSLAAGLAAVAAGHAIGRLL